MKLAMYLVWILVFCHLKLTVLTMEEELFKEGSLSRQCRVYSKVSEDVQCAVNSTCIISGIESVEADNNGCPVWFQCAADECVCYENYSDIVHCNSNLQMASVVDCYCVTYDHKIEDYAVGNCVEMCAHPHHMDLVDNVYHHLPNASLEFNEVVCKVSSRTGVLCGKCKNGTYPLVYSYSHSCIPSKKCGTLALEVAKYILAAYGPLTIFYIIVLLFQINVTSSYLHGFCLISQAVTMATQLRVILSSVSSNKILSNIINVFVSFFAIWNLDFFKVMYTESICFPIKPMAVTALNYGIAVYPLVLSIISYYLIQLYDRKIKIFVYLWQPMKYLLSIFQNKLNRHTSVVDAYATFFLLSYTKVLESSFNLLAPTILHHASSNKTSFVLFYDGTVEYFGQEHLPYALLALSFLTIVNIFPIIILLLYQCKFFQMMLSKLPLRLDILHTFMDLLQGCYQNGAMPYTRDLRWFSVIFLICRFFLFILFATTLNGMFFVYGAMICLVAQALIMLVQPFKTKFSHFARLNSIFIIFLVLFYTSIIGINIAAIVEKGGIIIEFYFVAALTALIPIVYNLSTLATGPSPTANVFHAKTFACGL